MNPSASTPSTPSAEFIRSAATDAVDPVAVVTGGTAGLGLALTTALTGRGWRIVTDGRAAAPPLPHGATVVRGDVADPRHRSELAAEVEALGRLDLLVHNASTLGPLPMRHLAELPGTGLAAAWRRPGGSTCWPPTS